MLDIILPTPLFRVTNVDRRVALRVWPLVQIAHPDVLQDEWLAYAKAIGSRRGKAGGAVAIEDGRGYIHALFAWHVNRTITRRKALRISDLVVGALPGKPLAAAIVAAIRSVASDAGADSVMVEIGDRQIPPDALLSDGFEQFVLSCLRIDKTQPAPG